MKRNDMILLCFGLILRLSVFSQCNYNIVDYELRFPNNKNPKEMKTNSGYYFAFSSGSKKTKVYSEKWLKGGSYDLTLKEVRDSSFTVEKLVVDSIFFSVIGTNQMDSKNEKVVLILNGTYISGFAICGGDLKAGLDCIINDFFIGEDKNIFLKEHWGR